MCTEEGTILGWRRTKEPPHSLRVQLDPPKDASGSDLRGTVLDFVPSALVPIAPFHPVKLQTPLADALLELEENVEEQSPTLTRVSHKDASESDWLGMLLDLVPSGLVRVKSQTSLTDGLLQLKNVEEQSPALTRVSHKDCCSLLQKHAHPVLFCKSELPKSLSFPHDGTCRPGDAPIDSDSSPTDLPLVKDGHPDDPTDVAFNQWCKANPEVDLACARVQQNVFRVTEIELAGLIDHKGVPFVMVGIDRLTIEDFLILMKEARGTTKGKSKENVKGKAQPKAKNPKGRPHRRKNTWSWK
uniref:Uncharacterized protein n=1 Tax=Chromera velia CCMP2878 TaxID=1169474 RepID=A0A0G4HTE7_9ALVE|eukprot:Cvel_8438.t1-p1 / transcript=Cvel_8438.t1 / gene=Cvel_8438 / organism=Chromera_velia_CCMP2878 / gene_product=hypothetical protein / transcript_product=hypothetical protein / location=Cvel_scaffold466:17050-17946(+) / protein_length=299 / sequence_SO=supercontig / SO=protein_coding / is_pseudo=false